MIKVRGIRVLLDLPISINRQVDDPGNYSVAGISSAVSLAAQHRQSGNISLYSYLRTYEESTYFIYSST